MALVWGAGDWVHQGSETESEGEACPRTPLSAPPGRTVSRCGLDAETLEAAVVLVVFHRVVRHFGVSRYRGSF